MERERYYQAAIAILLVGMTASVYYTHQLASQVGTGGEDAAVDPAARTAEDTVTRSMPSRVDLHGPFYAAENEGLIHPGRTDLALTIEPRLTGPLEITFGKGSFTDADGRTYTLPQNRSFRLQPDDEFNKTVAFFLVKEDQGVDIRKRSYLLNRTNLNRDRPERTVMTLIGYRWLVLEPGQDTLKNTEIPVFHVYRS